MPTTKYQKKMKFNEARKTVETMISYLTHKYHQGFLSADDWGSLTKTLNELDYRFYSEIVKLGINNKYGDNKDE